jgi:hypothetical protein
MLYYRCQCTYIKMAQKSVPIRVYWLASVLIHVQTSVSCYSCCILSGSISVFCVRLRCLNKNEIYLFFKKSGIKVVFQRLLHNDIIIFNQFYQHTKYGTVFNSVRTGPTIARLDENKALICQVLIRNHTKSTRRLSLE